MGGRQGQLGETHAHRVAHGKHPDQGLSEAEGNDPTHHVPVKRGSAGGLTPIRTPGRGGWVGGSWGKSHRNPGW